MAKTKHQPPITLLDGGMGRELQRVGAPFKQPEWSALSLIESPELVEKIHESFARAGSDIITTNNYAVVPFHIGEERFSREGAHLTALSGKLAKNAGSQFGCRIAGSLPPLFGSYRPDLFEAERAESLLRVIVDALDPYVDIWLAETVSSIEEAQMIGSTVSGDDHPLWISYSLEETTDTEPRLRSGEPVVDGVQAAIESQASALLFNCSQPESMGLAVETAIREIDKAGTDLPVGVYANAFVVLQKDVKANISLTEIRGDLNPDEYLRFVEDWCRLGATIIGGCCGIGPEHISRIDSWLKSGA